ncbi:hypothetical protein QJQ45_027351 [Haematococcus lacustris]|nr:hypothetical protein QJQ45_027351 [Haematococcus lacustris]
MSPSLFCSSPPSLWFPSLRGGGLPSSLLADGLMQGKAVIIINIPKHWCVWLWAAGTRVTTQGLACCCPGVLPWCLVWYCPKGGALASCWTKKACNAVNATCHAMLCL